MRLYTLFLLGAVTSLSHAERQYYGDQYADAMPQQAQPQPEPKKRSFLGNAVHNAKKFGSGAVKGIVSGYAGQDQHSSMAGGFGHKLGAAVRSKGSQMMGHSSGMAQNHSPMQHENTEMRYQYQMPQHQQNSMMQQHSGTQQHGNMMGHSGPVGNSVHQAMTHQNHPSSMQSHGMMGGEEHMAMQPQKKPSMMSRIGSMASSAQNKLVGSHNPSASQHHEMMEGEEHMAPAPKQSMASKVKSVGSSAAKHLKSLF